MAQTPEDREAAGPRIHLDIPLPAGATEPYTYVASKLNTALAETAYEEPQVEESGVIPVIFEMTLSPMYQIARSSLERDLAAAATEADRRMSIDIFASRMILVGTKLTEQKEA